MTYAAAGSRRRTIGAGAVWALVYNLGWGMSWYAFMRREWTAATSAAHRPMPWTAAAWHIWVVVTIPLGMAIMAYAAGRPRIYRAAVVGSVMIGLILQIGLTTYGGGQGLSWRVLVLDSVVNLGTIALAGVAGAWLLYQ